jgi:YVTN family beta-propeller protein
VISDATNTVIKTITVGTIPEGVAFDSNKKEVFVTNDVSPGTVSVISDATNTVTATITVGSDPVGIAFDLRSRTSSGTQATVPRSRQASLHPSAVS